MLPLLLVFQEQEMCLQLAVYKGRGFYLWAGGHGHDPSSFYCKWAFLGVEQKLCVLNAGQDFTQVLKVFFNMREKQKISLILSILSLHFIQWKKDWSIMGTLQIPWGMASYPYWPEGVIKAVLFPLSASGRIWWKPCVQSKTERIGPWSLPHN